MNSASLRSLYITLRPLVWLSCCVWPLTSNALAAQAGIPRSQISLCYQKAQSSTPQGLLDAGTCYGALVTRLDRQLLSRQPTRQDRQQYYLLATQAAGLLERSAAGQTKGISACRIRRDAQKMLGGLLARKMYLDTTQQQAAATQRAAIKARMTCGSLTIQVGHPKAEICVKGTSSGRQCKRGQWQRSGLAAGSYEVTVSYPKATPMQRLVTLGPEETKRLTFRPPAVPLATLKLTTLPTAATISINGTARGKTPLTLTMKPGTYQLTIRKQGYKPVQLKVRLQPRQIHTFTQPLEPLAPKTIPNKTRNILIVTGLVVTSLFIAGGSISYALATRYHGKANQALVLFQTKQLSYQGAKQLYEANARPGNIARTFGHISVGGTGLGLGILIWGLTQPKTKPQPK